MSRMNFVARVFGFVMLIAIVGGCEKNDMQKISIFRKDSLWRKDNIYARGYLESFSTDKRTYYDFSIGTPDNPLTKLPSLYLEWPNGEKVQLCSITPEMLPKMENVVSDYLPSTSPPPSSGLYKGASWPEGTKSFHVENPKAGKLSRFTYDFTVVNNKIVAICIYSGCPGFWNESLTKRYVFPLTGQDLEELFGKPDELVEYVTAFP